MKKQIILCLLTLLMGNSHATENSYDLGFSRFIYNGDYFISGMSNFNFNVSSINGSCNWEITGYLSKDADLDTTDIPLTMKTVYSYSDYSAIASIQDGYKEPDNGLYYLMLYLKSKCTTPESDTTNNWVKRQVIICENPVDIKLSQATMANEIQAGGSCNVNYTVSYSSLISINTSTVNFYLSSDSLFDKDADTLLNTRTFSWYNSKTYSGSIYVTYPDSKIGDFYLLCIIDADNIVNETNEDNNCLALPIRISEPYYDAEIISTFINYDKINNCVQTNITYKNSGNLYMEDMRVGYYLSDDSTCDINDRLLTNQYLYSISPGNTSNYQYFIYLDNTIVVEDKYLITRLDYNNSFKESDENNNYFVNLISDEQLPDNTTNFKYMSKKSVIGDSGLILDNGGVGNYQNNSRDTLIIMPATKNKKISMYLNSLSLETCCDYLSVYYGIFSDSTPSPTFIGNVSKVGTVYTSNDISGAISLVFYADGSSISSGFEIVFDTSSTITSNADIILNNFTLSKNSYIKNEYLNCEVYYSVKSLELNNYINFGFYFSNDTVLDLDDALITYYQSYTYDYSNLGFYNNFYLPSDIDTGTYYLICKADYMNSYPEKNKNNNTKYSKIQIVKSSMDLYITNFSNVSGILFKNIQYNMQLNIAKDGYSGSSGYIPTNLYLSKDKIIDSSDSIISTYNSSFYNSSSSFYAFLYFTLKNDLINGLYYLIADVNPGFEFEELDTTNNNFCIPVVLTKEENDLCVLPFNLTDSIVSGTYLSTYVTIKNIGLTRTDRISLNSYLSKDEVLDNDDYLISNSSYSYKLQPSETTSIYQDISTYNVIPGQYYLITKVFDDNYNANDIDTLNNVMVSPLYIRQTQSEIYPYYSQIDTILYPGNYWYNWYYVFNNGPDYCNNAKIKVYLSKDNKIDASDIIIGNSSYLSVYYLSTNDVYYSYYVPQNIEEGPYSLIVKVESQNDIDTTNNILIYNVKVPRTGPDFDLGITNVSLDGNITSLRPNIEVSGVYNITNNGLNNCYAFTMGLYLSIDSVLDKSDKLVWNDYIADLGSGSYLENNLDFMVPTFIPATDMYLIMKTDINGVIDDSNSGNNLFKIYLTRTNSVNALNSYDFNMYPNPVKNNLHISMKIEGDYTIKIIDFKGSILTETKAIDKVNIINMEKFNPGIYLLIIQDNNSNEFHYKIVKE